MQSHAQRPKPSLLHPPLFAVIATAVIVVASAACSSDSTPDVAADAGTDAVVDVNAADANDGGIEQDPNVYPADHQPIPLLRNAGNGPVITNPKLVTITFVGDAKRDAYRAFGDTILGTPWWTTIMNGFGVQPGSGGGYAELAPTWTGTGRVTISGSDIDAFLQRGITDGTIPRPVKDVLYAFYFPKNVTVQNGSSGSCQQFLAYHTSTTVLVPDADAGVSDAGADAGEGGAPPTGTPVEVPYAVIPVCDTGDATATFEQTTVAASHEFAEAATDPFPNSGQGGYLLDTDDSWLPPFYPPGSIIENGDACFELPAWTEGNYKVQRSWTNAAAMVGDQPCQPVPQGRVYFAAAVRTIKQNANGHSSYGYLFVKRGQSASAIVNVFSLKALPHDLLLYVGAPKANQSDPSDLAPLKNEIQVQLSRQTAHNGNGAVLQVTVPDTSTTGDFRMVVRAVLEPDDYNDWPLIVHVRP